MDIITARNRVPGISSVFGVFPNGSPTSLLMMMMTPSPPLLLLMPFLLLLLQLPAPTGASCYEDEVQRCREAAVEGNLPDLKSGGLCQPNEYGTFTHNCLLNQYDPEVRHCCCHIASKVLCCSYHQSGTHYRCNEDEDVAVASESVSVEIWVAVAIAVLVGLVLLGGVIFCLKRRQEQRRASKKGDQQSSETPENSEEVPLSSQPTENGSTTRSIIREAGEEKVLFYNPSTTDDPEPTAPPPEDAMEIAEGSDDVFPLPNRPSGSLCNSQVCESCMSVIPQYSRSVSYPEEDTHVTRPSRPRFHSCASCPPPPYAEHHHDRLAP